MSNNGNKPKTLREGLDRLRGLKRDLYEKDSSKDLADTLADILEILIIMGFNTDSRSLDIDVTNLRP